MFGSLNRSMALFRVEGLILEVEGFYYVFSGEVDVFQGEGADSEWPSNTAALLSLLMMNSFIIIARLVSRDHSAGIQNPRISGSRTFWRRSNTRISRLLFALKTVSSPCCVSPQPAISGIARGAGGTAALGASGGHPENNFVCIPNAPKAP